jgi:hypothetical protein
MKKHPIKRIPSPLKIDLCNQRGCKMFGKEARQGVCYDNRGELVDFTRLEAHELTLLEELRRMRKLEGSKYVKALEAYYMSAMINWQMTLDECIRLRGKLAMAGTRLR